MDQNQNTSPRQVMGSCRQRRLHRQNSPATQPSPSLHILQKLVIHQGKLTAPGSLEACIKESRRDQLHTTSHVKCPAPSSHLHLWAL